MTAPPVQQTLQEALIQPSERRIWFHRKCGGYLLFDLRGGFCVHCGDGPLKPDEYAKHED